MIKMELTFYDVINYLWLSLSRKWHFAREHDVQDNAHRPNVNFRVVILKENFRRHVVRRPA